jgi:peptidoglycan/LPS O-acetylase OafA/YrhL
LLGWDQPVDRVSWPAQLVRLLAFFAAGSALWTVRAYVPTSPRLAVLAGAIALSIAGSGFSALLAPLPLAYALLSLARFLPDVRRDLSYGVYLYGFPVQQLLHQTIPSVHGWTFALLASPAVLGLGWLSWEVVERPSLRWAASQRSNRQSTRRDAVPSPS